MLDGHHRVSVARSCGIEYMDAEVREYVFAAGGQQTPAWEGELVTPGVGEQWFPRAVSNLGICRCSEDYIPNEALPSAA
ncbi:MAG TPA: hypothetical protein VEX13_11495 [Chloroflexia bacterium]|nr:hypothetical protein [Chloroflexia bacterium]